MGPFGIERGDEAVELGLLLQAMFGATDRIAQMYKTVAPWMTITNPRVAEIPKFTGEPNFEELLARKVDLVFQLREPKKTAKLESLGIPALVSQRTGGRRDSRESFIADTKASVRLFGDVLGPEAQVLAEQWCAYLDQKIALVDSRIRDIPMEKRPRVYYMRGPHAANTQGLSSNTFWYGTLAGANMVVKDQAIVGLGAVSPEDLIRWDPEFVLVGRQYPLELMLDDSRWKGISAVRTGRVLSTPEGVFYWDGAPESMLLMIFMAKRLYPERFMDIDMTAELQTYYRRFYRYSLSDAEAALLLSGRAPDGSRHNSMNN